MASVAASGNESALPLSRKYVLKAASVSGVTDRGHAASILISPRVLSNFV
jgi:hypothetical protein